MPDRPHRPQSVDLQIRQRCGFGCVMCGSPIYDYEHIFGIGETGDDPDSMTLLCPHHHREKTAGRLPLATVVAANANPHNGVNEFSAGHELYFSSNQAVTFDLGNVQMSTSPESLQSVGIIIDGAVALGARIVDGHLRLDLNFRDLNNKPLLQVADGVLRFANRSWDITYVGKNIKIRRANRDVVLDMHVDASASRVTIKTADFALNGVRVHVGKRAWGHGIWFPNSEHLFADVAAIGTAIIIDASRQGFGGPAFSGWPRAYGSPPAPVGSFRARKDVRPWGMSGVRRSILSAGATGSASPYTLAPHWEEPPRSCVSAAAALPADDGRARASSAGAAAAVAAGVAAPVAAPAEDAR